MTPVAIAVAEPPVTKAPAPPAPPTTVAETGLHPDTLSQLMLKTLIETLTIRQHVDLDTCQLAP